MRLDREPALAQIAPYVAVALDTPPPSANLRLPLQAENRAVRRVWKLF